MRPIATSPSLPASPLAAASLTLALLAGCEDPTLEGPLTLAVQSELPAVRVDLFDAAPLQVSLVEPGRVLGGEAALKPALRVARGAGSWRLYLKDGIPDERALVLVAWADADGDGALDLDPAGRSESARVVAKERDLLVAVESAPDHWQGTLRSVAGTRALAEGNLEGWAATLDALTEGPPLADRDDDGLADDVERRLGTDPGRSDSDGDGALDGAEVGDPENPNDEDDDGALDALEPDDVDDDGDGASAQEDADDLDPCVPSADACDSDEDGLSDGREDAVGTDAWDPDTDGDGQLDGDEDADSDGDGVSDAVERDDRDADGDGTVDQYDPADADPCVPVLIPGCDGDPPPPP